MRLWFYLIVRLSVFLFIFCHLSAFHTVYAHIRDLETVVSISAVGDCTLGYDERENYVNSFAYYYERNRPDYFFKYTKPLIAEDDLFIANCEGVLADSADLGEPQDHTYIHRGDAQYADIFKQGGVDAVNLANNHTMDFYAEGFAKTRQSLEQYEVSYFGKGYTYITEVNDIKIGFLAYSGYTNGFKTTARNDIRRLKEDGVQLVIVSYHWGDDKANYPNDIQYELGRDAIDYGADLVLGHHPHVIQGLELYKGKYIVYSLGNFCYGGSKKPGDMDTFIYRQRFAFLRGKLKNSPDIEIIPMRCSSIRERNDYRPTPVGGEDAARIYERLTNYSRPFNTVIPLPSVLREKDEKYR